MAVHAVARTTRPQLSSLADELRDLLAVANAGSFTLRWQEATTGNTVVIEQGSFAGVDLTAVAAAVAAAPDWSEARDAQDWVANMPLGEKALLLTLLDQINVLRTAAGLGTVTVAQALAAVKTKAGTL